MLTAGLGLLLAGRLMEQEGVAPWGVSLVVVGGVVVAASHLFNRRLCRSCDLCRATEPCR